VQADVLHLPVIPPLHNVLRPVSCNRKGDLRFKKVVTKWWDCWTVKSWKGVKGGMKFLAA
jgi:hypothetical protein